MASRSAIGAEGRKRFMAPREAEPVVARPSLKEARAATQKGDGPTQDAVGKGGVLKDHVFNLDYTDGRNRRWTGEFKCHALTYRERIDIGLIRSRMSGGVSPNMLDITTANLLEMVAHLSVALDSGPDWARDLEGIHDPAVVTEIYKEVLAHEQRFHESGPGDSGPEDDADGATGDGAGASY